MMADFQQGTVVVQITQPSIHATLKQFAYVVFIKFENFTRGSIFPTGSNMLTYLSLSQKEGAK